MIPIDPVDLTARLLRCRSVTPDEGGALVVLEDLLRAAGFACTRVDRGGIANLFARFGPKGHPRTFGFNGHTDVVPVGNAADWSVDPFGGVIRDGMIWGRGAADMKSAVAAFTTAAICFARETPPQGALILAITGDEEGAGRDGTRALLDWMLQNGEAMTDCLVGEPTCPDRMGEMLKIGRRGSMTAYITAEGVQGHAAYPHRAKNPLPVLVRLLDRLASHRLDAGTDHFDPSTLALTTVDTGNPANNVIPAKATATVNIRFNDAHTSESLSDWLRQLAAEMSGDTGVTLDLRIEVSGESFITPPGPLSDLVVASVQAETGVTPVLSTSGGTSDARFIKNHCPVVEFGLVGNTMHQVDERVDVAQITALTAIYRRILSNYFDRPSGDSM